MTRGSGKLKGPEGTCRGHGLREASEEANVVRALETGQLVSRRSPEKQVRAVWDWAEGQ